MKRKYVLNALSFRRINHKTELEIRKLRVRHVSLAVRFNNHYNKLPSKMINSPALDLFRSALQAYLKEVLEPKTSCWDEQRGNCD